MVLMTAMTEMMKNFCYRCESIVYKKLSPVLFSKISRVAAFVFLE